MFASHKDQVFSGCHLPDDSEGNEYEYIWRILKITKSMSDDEHESDELRVQEAKEEWKLKADILSDRC